MIRCDVHIYMTREEQAKEIAQIASAFGSAKKLGRKSILVEVAGKSTYIDKELKGYLEERFMNRKLYAIMDEKKMDAWLTAAEEQKDTLAESFFRKKAEGKYKTINIVCALLCVAILGYLLLR